MKNRITLIVLLLCACLLAGLMAGCGSGPVEIKNELDHSNPLPQDSGVKVTEQTFDEENLTLGLPSGVTAELKATEVPGSSAQDIYVTKEGANWQFIFHPISGPSGNYKHNLTSFRDAAFVADYDTCEGQIQGMNAEFYAWNVGDGHLDASTRYHQPAYDIVIDYGETAVGAWTALSVDLQSSVQTNIYELINDKDVAAILNHFTIIIGDEGQVLSSGGITITVPSAWTGFQDSPSGPSGHFPATFPTAGSISVTSVFGADPADQATKKGDAVAMTFGDKEYLAVKEIGDQYSYLYLYGDFNDERALCVTLQMATSDESVLDDFAAGDVFAAVVNSIEIDPEGYFDSSTKDKEGDWIVGKDGELAEYTGSDTAVEIPDTISGRPVTVILAEVFKDNESIVSVTIPEGVTKIASSTFENCANLETVVFPSTLEEIQQNAFLGCPKLADVVLPAAVTSIGDYAFYESGSGSFTAEGPAVYGARALEDTTFESISIGAGSDLSAEAVFSGTQAVDVTIGEGSTGLGKSAFNAAANVRELILPDSMTVLGENALAGMSSLKKLTLPANLERIEAYAMSGTAPFMVVIPETVTYIGTSGVGADTAFLMNGNGAELETDSLVCSYIYLNGIYDPNTDIEFNVDALYISQQMYLPADATISESEALDQFLMDMGWRDIAWIGIDPEHFDPDFEDYTQDGNWLTGYTGDKTELWIPEAGETFGTWNQCSIWWINDRALADLGLTAVSFGSVVEWHSQILDGNPDLADIWFSGDIVIRGSDKFQPDTFQGVPENVTVHLPDSLTDSERSSVRSVLEGAGMPASASYEYYSYR